MAEYNRIVVKVGTSTLTYDNGKPNIGRIDKLCRVLSDISNSGKEVVLVTSGAIGVGVSKLGLSERPAEIPARQACAAVGQCELMYMYDKFFGEYGKKTAQVLITADVIDNESRRANVSACMEELLKMGAIPVVNENDAVSVDELTGHNIGDNDNLSSIVAVLINADALIMLTDKDGLFDRDPGTYPDAVRIPVVLTIDDNVCALAGGSGSKRGTGGMITKLQAAQRSCGAGIETYICAGDDPENVRRILAGDIIGTHFVAKRNNL